MAVGGLPSTPSRCSRCGSLRSFVPCWPLVTISTLLTLATQVVLCLESAANTLVTIDLVADMRNFSGQHLTPDHFRVVHIDGNSMLVGARNVVYNVSLDTLRENKRIFWEPSSEDKQTCSFYVREEEPEQCNNDIRVISPTQTGDMLVCGTNAFNPRCRTYKDDEDEYAVVKEESGVAICPFDPRHNNTALHAGGRFFSATVSDKGGRDALIYSESMRTVNLDSMWLNEPDFINSFDYLDKVYFFFRETAVEYINCGKARFSRVARICKNDKGGPPILKKEWTSFFKARLNCSLPGEYPFYFDEIQATSDLGIGNVMSSLSAADSTAMVYAVFSTPQNSIPGSAVCAFRFSDIIQTFEGKFKEQETPQSSWLPVEDKKTPDPHPAKSCVNDSHQISARTLDFIKTHPLMDKAVPAFGGAPVLLRANLDSHRLTTIAVDWQVRTADGRIYDVLFLGTSNGHVLKAINVGSGDKIETVVIEDIEVFSKPTSVLQLRVYRDVGRGQEKLVVISSGEVRSIPLHRCHLHTTCSMCVAAQDPYCAWTNNICANTNIKNSLQSLQTGRHSHCPVAESTPEVPSEELLRSQKPAVSSTEMDNSIPRVPEQPDGCVCASVDQSTAPAGLYSAGDMAAAVVLSILCCLGIGFFLGYRFFLWRQRTTCEHDSDIAHNYPSNPDKVQNPYNLDPTSNIHRNDTGQSLNHPEKQLNVVYNPLKNNSGKIPNGEVETTVSPGKSKKVYV